MADRKVPRTRRPSAALAAGAARRPRLRHLTTAADPLRLQSAFLGLDSLRNPCKRSAATMAAGFLFGGRVRLPTRQTTTIPENRGA